jgi:hypothetical protein
MLQRSNVANKRSMCAVYTVRKRHICVMPMWIDRQSDSSHKSQKSYLKNISKYIILQSYATMCWEFLFYPFVLTASFDTILSSSDGICKAHHKSNQYEFSINNVQNF